MDYPRIFKEFVTLSTHYPKNIQGLSNHLTLDNGWINPRSTSPTFVLTLSTFLEVQGVEDKPRTYMSDICPNFVYFLRSARS